MNAKQMQRVWPAVVVDARKQKRKAPRARRPRVTRSDQPVTHSVTRLLWVLVVTVPVRAQIKSSHIFPLISSRCRPGGGAWIKMGISRG